MLIRSLRVGFALGLIGCAGTEFTTFEPVMADGRGGGSTCPGLPTGTTSLSVSPSSATLVVGESIDLAVENQAGISVPDCAVKWSSSNVGIATVDGVGNVFAVSGGGPVRIRAQSGGKKPLVGSASVRVDLAPTTLVVPGTANVFGYGLLTPAPAGGGGGTVAPSAPIAAIASSWVEIGASGAASPDGPTMVAPDGADFDTTDLLAVGPISGLTAPLAFFLTGVFVPDGDISLLTAPSNYSYPNPADLGADSFAPALRQVFYIGDGLSGAGTPQRFVVPAGATRLVLGYADGYSYKGLVGGYFNNAGSVTAVIKQRW